MFVFFLIFCQATKTIYTFIGNVGEIISALFLCTVADFRMTKVFASLSLVSSASFLDIKIAFRCRVSRRHSLQIKC